MKHRADRLHAQRGATLAVVLGIGLVLAITLYLVAGRSGRSRIDTVKNMKATQDFYLADAGFNYIKTRVMALNRKGGVKSVDAFLASQKGSGWQPIGFGTSEMGSFRLEDYKLVPIPLSVELKVQGVKDPSKANPGMNPCRVCCGCPAWRSTRVTWKATAP